MNEFIMAGLFLTVLVIYIGVMLFIAVIFERSIGIDATLIIAPHVLFTIICALFAVGGVPYVIMTWLIIFGAMLGYALYIELTDKK